MRAALLALSIMALTLPAVAGERAEGTAAPIARAFPSLTTIYIVPGVFDDGGSVFDGVATSFHCFNAETTTKQIRFIVKGAGGTVVSAKVYNISAQRDFTASTHATQMFAEDALLSETISLKQGTVLIQATSANIFCTAMIVNGASLTPDGIALHMIRRNPAAGTDE